MTQGEAIDLMDDARNNPPLNDEGERAATNPVATQRAQLPTVSDLAEILSGVSAAIINDDFEAHDYHIRRYTDAITAVYSRLAELEKVAVVAAEAIRTLDTYADDVRADWSDFDGRANRRELHAIVADLREQLRASSEGARAQ